MQLNAYINPDVPDVSNSHGSCKFLPHQEPETCGAISSFRIIKKTGTAQNRPRFFMY
jgi:hypothetical protein